MTKEDKYQLEVDKNYNWFLKNKKNIVKENPKKIGYFALIKNQVLIGLYKTHEEVILEANKRFKNEPYSIQELQKEEIIHNLGYMGLQWVR